MIIGTAIFYFIIIGANALENKIIRLSQNGISELSVPFILSDEEGPVEILSFSDDNNRYILDVIKNPKIYFNSILIIFIVVLISVLVSLRKVNIKNKIELLK
ncbi:MAG: hypothetical protein WC907_05585 [Acholeplasmataceae bacterium]